jgi:ATP-dependent Clp protease ATP-binding subunit ClpC
VEQIVELQMKEVSERMGEQGLTVELTPAARTWLAKQGYDPSFGARPLRRAIQKYVESPLSVQLLRGDFPEGSHVLVDAEEANGIVFRSAGIRADINADHPV